MDSTITLEDIRRVVMNCLIEELDRRENKAYYADLADQKLAVRKALRALRACGVLTPEQIIALAYESEA